jgi:hypothetical protein
MAEKEALKLEAEVRGTLTLELDPTLGVLSPGLVHAAAVRAAVAAAVVQASFLVTRCKQTTRFVPGQKRPPYATWSRCAETVPYGSFQSISSAPWLTR